MNKQSYNIHHPEYWKKKFSDTFDSLVGKYDAYQIFKDFLGVAANLLSNGVDGTHAPERHAEILRIMSGYDDRECAKFYSLISSMQEFYTLSFPVGFDDLLGTFMERSSMGNKRSGQDFSPDSFGTLMSKIILNNDGREHISLSEPACGSGNLILKFAEQMRPERNPSNDLCVTAVDSDLKCVYMTYIQLSYYCIPAVVIHGDTLLVEEYSRWYTPTYVKNDWTCRQQCSMTDKRPAEDIAITYARHPMLGFLMAPKLMSEIERKVQKGEVDDFFKVQKGEEGL